VSVVLVAVLPALSGWDLVSESGPTRVFRRAHENSRVYEHKVESIIQAPPERVWEVLRDTKGYSEFMPYVAESRVVGEKGNWRLVYQRLDPPVLDDRDYTVQIHAIPDPERGVYEQTFEIAPRAGPAPRDGVVRVRLATGRWRIEPTANGSTRIVYQLITDPGGWVPRWFVNLAQKQALPGVIDALRQRATDPKYRKDT
jgi:ribosome-associated toxin RatA of RatAB toxin-antitoxin module